MLDDDLSTLTLSTWLFLASDVISVAAALCGWSMVRRVQAAQEKAHQEKQGLQQVFA